MGPLAGYRVPEIAAIGPVPMCAMLLSDMGAEVLRLDRMTDPGLGVARDATRDPMMRGRRSVAVDLKMPGGVETVLRLAERADALIEGFRPGVAERLGIGPEDCRTRNRLLVYGRMTGWGQDGLLATTAGHDINYIALSGALHAIGEAGGPPLPPLNLIGDYGGGALYLALGVVAALLEAKTSGRGQVIDAAMVDGAASLMTVVYGLKAAGSWQNERGVNLLDGGAPYYGVYETADGKYLAIGAIEPKFYAELLEKCGLADAALPAQNDRDGWPELRARLAQTFKGRSRDEWCEIFAGSDACFAPVLDLDEAPDHPHNTARGSFAERGGVVQPAPAPRFSRTVSEIGGPPREPGADTDAALASWGFDGAEIARLRHAGAIA